MPPNLYYQDVDKEYLKGYFDEMDEIYKTTYDEPLDKWFKFPVDRFSVPQKDLSETAQKLRFKFEKEYDSIKKDLDNLGRSPIQVRPGMNCAFEAICIQVYTPPGYNAYMLRRQACCFMAEFVHVFFPLMKNYLEERKIGFTMYLEKMFTGEIWCDEFVLAAIGKMWQIRITIVSPFYVPPWDIFHNGSTPHVVLIANGADFGKQRGVSHFSSSKGKGKTWRCVQPLQRIGEVAKYYGRSTGSLTAATLYQKVAKRVSIEKATCVTDALNDICEALQSLMDKKEKLIQTMDELNFEVDVVKNRQKFVVVSSDEYAKLKLAAVRRIEGDVKTKKKEQTEKKSNNASDIVVTTEQMEGLMDEFVSPAAHEKVVLMKAQKKNPPEGYCKTSKTDVQHSLSKKRKKEKNPRDMSIKKMVMRMNEKEEEKQKLLKCKKHQSDERINEEPLPTLGDYEELIQDHDLSMEPGVIRVRDAALPLEEKQPKVHENIEELSEYSGKFEGEISEKDRQNVDKYLVEQDVITTQPGSVHTDITRVQHYPDYSEISANAPDNTPVLYQGVPFDKGSVDLFM